ncbi:MAG: undecaprenyl-diphosphate phosphatase [Bacteroidia bacterium]|nr:undecaprenyl-diphosphate phosphatase [Bacteroidia bacterium]
MSWLEAIIIAIVEGLTEFLPVSSTGHMILTQSLLGIQSSAFLKLFIVSIQLGAILSVIVLYKSRFFKSTRFYLKLFVGFIPAAIVASLLGDRIDRMLESPLVVAVSLLAGGVVLLFVDKWFDNTAPSKPTIEEEPKYRQAFIIGIFQCIALIPGVSRSAATIIGGMAQKLSRNTAAEFSFFLAVPTMFAATAKKSLDFYQEGNSLNTEELQLLLLGNLVAFIVALLAIRFFIAYLQKHGFRVFGWYRILVGLAILCMLGMGVDLAII